MAGRDQEEPYVPLPTADGGDPPDAAVPVLWRRHLRLASVAIVSILILGAIALIAVGRSNDNDEASPMENNPCSVNLSALPSYRSRGVREGVSDKSTSAGLLGHPAECPYPWTNDVLSWQRTGFHFQPEQNWMNDPNGPLFYNGWYHLFYQYNPDSAVWGNITWGHAVSKDLIRWVHLPLAMVADKWYDTNGVWTGSATILPDGRLVMLYTGSTNDSVQVQNLAFPADESDPLLTDWVKSDANPVLLPPTGVLPQDFRDPTTAWFEPSDSTWRIAIGSKDTERAGVTYVYKTYDFLRYELLPGTLHRVEGTGMWECVDFYPIASGGGARDALVGQGLDTSVPAGPGVKHVLKASMDDDRHDYYAIGTYDVAANEWAPDNPEADVGLGLRYDWGKFYAAKTFYDQDKSRRVLWGWIGETDSERADVLKGWASLQGIPRSVLFDTKTGSNLLQWPVKEVETLRMSGKNFSGIRVDSGSVFKLDVPSATQLDIEAVFEVEANALVGTIEADVGYNCSNSGGAGQRGALGPFGLLVLADQDRSEQTAAYFYISRAVDGRLRTHFCHDETRSSRARDIVKRIVGSTVPVLDGERLSLRVLVDHSIVESFAQGGRACITSRVYPTRAIYRAARVFLFNNATSAYVTAKSLKIWEMNSAVLRPDSAAR